MVLYEVFLWLFLIFGIGVFIYSLTSTIKAFKEPPKIRRDFKAPLKKPRPPKKPHNGIP
jgi:hypothetical protein